MLITEKDVTLEFNLPGYKKSDIKIKLSGNSAEIKGERKHLSETKRKDFFHKESHHQSFHYSTTLPKINPKKAKTTFNNGVLKIKAPKALN